MAADTHQTVAVFESLQLSSLPTDWVTAFWEADFTEHDALPVDYEDLLLDKGHFIEELEDVQKVVTSWLERDNQNENGEGLWSLLVESSIPHKSLVAFLAYLSCNAGKVSVSCTEKIAGVLAASVYLKLVAVPGSSAFKMYNPELLLQACRLLKAWNKIDCGNQGKKKNTKGCMKASQKSQRGNQRKRPKRNSLISSQLSDAEESMEDEFDEVQWTSSELAKFTIALETLLQDVVIVCEKVSLRQSESTATQLMSVLVTLTRIDPESVTQEMGQWSDVQGNPSFKAYKAMYLMCQPFQGHVTALINEAFKLLLNHIVMLEDGKLFSNFTRPLLMMRQQALDFVMYLVSQLGEKARSSVKTLIQMICFRVPDKSEYRSHAAQAVCRLLDCLPDLDFANMLQWLKVLSKYKKVSQRSFMVDLMGVLLENPERKLSGDIPADVADFAKHKSMVCVLLSRCSDTNASVRARALVAFSLCTSSKHTNVVSTIREVITPIATQGRPTAKHFMPTPLLALHKVMGEKSNCTEEHPVSGSDGGAVVVESPAVASNDGDNNGTPTACVQQPSFCGIENTPGFNPYLPDAEGVVSMFRRRAVDTKVGVRKSALQALKQIIQFEAPGYRSEDLEVLQIRCMDPALSVRKQASQSLVELLQAFPQDKNIQRACMHGLLPQVTDRETSVQEKCFEYLEEMILLNLKPFGRPVDTNIAWDLLNIIADEDNENLRRYLQKACQYWARMQKFGAGKIKDIRSHVGSTNDQAVWMFLAEIAKTKVKISHDFVLTHWKTLTHAVQEEAACSKWSNVLCVLSHCVKSMPEHDMEDLLGDLQQRLSQFSYPTMLIARMVIAVSNLYSSLDSETSLSKKQAWGKELMATCDKDMSNVILNAIRIPNEIVEEERLIKQMFTLGEVVQTCPTSIPKRASLLIQSIIAAPCIGEIGNSEQFSSASHSSHSKESESSQELQSSHEREPSTQISSQSSQSKCSSQPLSQFRGSNMSNSLRSHAFITLGKMCLGDEALAKKMIAALARELEESDCPAVRNNVVIVMSNLTIRYTTLVDRYITNIAACLKDPSALVRKNTLTVLTRLLQEDFVKWKGVLFFRYITAFLDDVVEIKNLAVFSLVHLLLHKHPGMFFHPFIECIFHFNNYLRHDVYNKFKQTDREKQKFTLAGESNASRRLQLYTFMLEHMTDEQRFKITDKINKEILSAVVDQILPLDDEVSLLLHDALAILSSKEIKLSTLRTRADEAGDENEDVAQIVTATAKRVLITQVVKRNVIENIVPVVISLKHMLEKNRSPLLKKLMVYLRELMKDYKNEVKDILAADKQLAEEIEFDLRNFELQQAQKESNPSSRRASFRSTPNSSRPTTPVVGLQHSRGTSPATPQGTGPSTSPVIQQSSPLRERTEAANVCSEQQERPCMPAPAKPLRRSSLTIIDAAKRAMTRVDQLRSQSFTPQRKSPLPTRTSQARSPAGEEFQSEDFSKGTEENMQISTASRDVMRAISTPTGAMNNITFGGEQNITLFPPSPIPSVASATKRGKLCISPSVRVTRRGNKDIIQMPHPDSIDPCPEKWRIQSPTAKQGTQSVLDDVTGDKTPTRKGYAAARAGLRKSSRQKSS